MRTHRRWLNTLLACFMGFWQVATPLSAATVYWDADGNDALNATDGTNLGGTGTWDTSSLLWWPAAGGADVAWANGAADIAIFSAPFAAIANSATVTLGTLSGVEANQLRFNRSGYTLSGGDFTLLGTTPTLYAALGVTATIDSQILGTEGFTKSGGGTIRLASGNTYTGATILNNGTLIITDQSALGMDSSAISVSRINPATGATAVRGFGGGSLVLDGTGGNIIISRDLILQGNGPWSDRGAAIVSTGVNTLSGTVDMGGLTNGANVNTRIIAADGTLNLTGTLNVNGTAATTISQLGGVNQAGASFYNVTGVLTGTGTLEGSGGGTLFLNPTDSSGFSGTIRVSASAASGQSVVRIDSAGVLGTRTASTTSAVLDLNGGTLAVLMDSPDVKVSNGTNANVYFRAASFIFADHTPNSSVKDQTVNFGNMSFEDNITLTFNSRNGYGMSFTTAPVAGSTAGDNNSTITNNLQGGAQLTFTGNFWSNANNTGSRTMTIGGAGNTTINGSIIASAAAFDHILTKSGAGTLTLLGTASTLDGAININGGTIAISDRRAITNNSSNININGGILSIIGNNVSQANLTFAKVINLSGTTGSATLLANQTGTSPGLILNADFTASGAGSKTLTLGGANIGANTINGAIVDNSGTNKTSLTKIDAGRWVLAGSNTYSGATTISNGTLQLAANAATSTILADTSAITFDDTNGYAGGTLEFIGQASTNNVETLGTLTPTNGSGTIKLTPGSGGTASIVFASLGAVGGVGTVNIVTPTASNTVSFASIAGLTAGSIANAGIFFNGSDFAFVSGAGLAVRAPDYATDADFATSATVLTADANNEITGSFSTGAALAIDSLKIKGSQTLTLDGDLTIRTAAGASASGGIIQTGGSGTITGAFSVGTNNAAALFINVDGGANSLTLESAIFGTGGLTKAGQGTLRIAGNNAFTGTLAINEGTVRMSSGGDLSAGAGNDLIIRQGAVWELNGITPTAPVNAFNNNGIIRNTSATTDVTLTVGGSDGTGTSNGIIEDGGTGKVSVVKIGAGDMTWNGLSTYTGSTTIGSTGIVSINNLQNGGEASAIGASSSAAGNLIFNGTSATQAFGGLSYTGTTNDETDRLFTFDGGADGGVRIQANGVNHATSSWTNTGALAFGANATGNAQGLVLGGTSTGDNRFSPIITDNGAAATSVYKADAGVWYLEATNTYSGVTQINAGTLYAQDGTNIKKDASTGSNIVLNGGTLASTGTLVRTIGTAGDQMRWQGTASGGFSAGGTSLTVDWGTGNVWGTTAGFLGAGAALLLNNSGVAKADVTILSGFDLGGGTRTVTVGDNTNIGADFATLAGVITNAIGTGNLTKNGTGILNLRGDNLYNGATAVTAGTLVVESLGNSASAAGTATSVGISGSGTTFSNTNAITLGNASTTGGILEYVGLGEISDRKIRLNTTTGTNQIHADGVGSLILTNVANDMKTGAKILSLRGVSSAANFITSKLSNNGGNLSITVDGSTAWILTNGANDYSGTTTVSAGALGIGDNGALGTGNLDLSNGSVFAYGGDRIITNAVRLLNNTGPAFMGDYSLAFTKVLQVLAAANNVTTLTNNLVEGKTLTFSGVTANSLTANRTWTIDGSGMTIFDGDITTSTAFGLAITKTGNGTLVLGGSASNNFNQASQNLDIDRGVLQLGANDVIGDGVGFGSVILSPELAGGDTATLDLNGHSETINGLTMNTDGTAIIDNTSATAASLTFGANDSAVSIGGGTGNYIVQNSGGGALSITKTGTQDVTIPTGVTLTYTGTTAVNGGSLTIASPVNGTTGLSVTNASTLALTGGITTPTAITTVVVDGGSTLSLLDGAGNQLSMLTNLQLGSMGGTMTTLNLNVGDVSTDPTPDMLATDTLTLLTGGTLSLFTGNQITLNLTDAGLNGNSTYYLIDVTDGGLTLGALGVNDWILGATPGGFSFVTLNKTDTLISITTGNLITGTSYWRGALGGGTDTTWNGNANNWSVDIGIGTGEGKAGTNAAASTPGSGTDVVFQWDAPSNAAVVTTLEQNFKINSLTFEDATVVANTATSITIDPGLLTPNARLEIAPQIVTDGIKVLTTNATSAIISGSVKLGGVATGQTWEVTNAGSLLSLGSLFGERDVTKTGAGKVTLTAAADPTFNIGVTSDFTISAGTLEILNSAALGNTVNANLATVTVNSTGAFYYNGATGTVANNLTLGGGTLSAGTANQTYSGTVNVSADSFINMADSNGPAANTARSITLSGVLSGSGKLTVDSNTSTLAAGNAESGTLTISNNSNTWNGPVVMNSGTIVTTATNGLGDGGITFNQYGRIIMRNVNGTTYDLAGTMDFAAGAIGEFSVDNTSGTLAADFVINQNGLVTLGSGGTGAIARFSLADVASQLNLTGGVVLGGDSSISVEGGDADSFVTISSIISDGGSGYALAIHDDAGAWAATDTRLLLTGANTFSGDLTLASGILMFDTASNVGTASSLGKGTNINITGASTLSFVGGANQSTARLITTTASLTLDASGTAGAIITYAGLISQGTDNTLTLSGTGEGVISGGIAQVAGAATADLTVSSGIWTIQDTNANIADDLLVNAGTLTLKNMVLSVNDDVVVTGTSAVLNLNSTGVWAATTPAGTSSGLHVRTGGTINLNADDVNGVGNSGGLDFILLGDSGGPEVGFLNTNTFNISTARLDLGQRAASLTGQIDGTGTVNVIGGDINLYDGIVNANLASTGTTSMEKYGPGTVTLRGDNSGLNASTILYQGLTVFDYTANNATKVRTASALDMRGSSLTLFGSASAATSQTVGSFTLGSGGSSQIILTPNGQDLVLNLGAITRANVAQDGTIRFFLAAGTQSATNGVTTTSPNSVYGLLGTGTAASADSAYATVNDGTGTWFATRETVNNLNVVALTSTAKDDVTTWLKGDHITDSNGFTGTLQSGNINSLRYDAAGGSDLVIADGGVLLIGSGGFLITDNVGGTPSLMGGTLASGATELVITQDSTQTFEIGSDIRIDGAVTKTGTGTLRLSGNNIYTGATEIQDGKLQVTGNSIGDISLVTLATYRDTTLQLLADETIGRLQGGQRATNSDFGIVDVDTFTLTINQAANTTFSGQFTGTGNIAINGPGNLNLNNISAGFIGVITVDTATLQLSQLGEIRASTIRVRKGSQLLFDNTSTTAPTASHVLDTATITLNSADGGFSGQAIVRGLSIRVDQNNRTADETVGVVNLNTGASYVGMEASSTGADADIIASDIVRLNNSTLSVRGYNLGINNTRGNQFRIVTANDAPFIAANLVGGGGAAASMNISIVPWAIGENLTGNLTANNMGNSLVTYLSGLGFRPLDFASEYNTLSAAAATDNVRESLGANLTGLAGTTINALVLNNDATLPTINVTGTGGGQALAVTSGAMLFTVTGAATNTAYSTVLGGFDSGISLGMGTTGEYVIHVVNPNSQTNIGAASSSSTVIGSTRVTVSSTAGLAPGMAVYGAGIPVGATVESVTDATHFEMTLPAVLSTSSQTFNYSTNDSLSATIASNLTSAADITKSGRGALILSGTNTAGGASNKTTINEGILEIAGLANIGGTTGDLVFSGGTLRLGTGLTDDISLRTITILQGGATIDTNGVDLALANSVGSGIGGLTKTGAGNLTLNAAATYTGATTILGGKLTVGANNATGVGGDLGIGAGATLDIGTNSITAGLVQTFGISPTLSGTGTITATKGFYFGNAGNVQIDAVLAGNGGLFKNQTNVLTLNGANTFTGRIELQAGELSFATIGNVGSGTSNLGAPTTLEDGIIRTGLTSTSVSLTYTGIGSSTDRIIEMQGTTGGLTINANGTGALLLSTVRTANNGAKTLTLGGTSTSDIINSLASIDECVETLSINKVNGNTWFLSDANNFSGSTTLTLGVLKIGNDASLGTSTITFAGGTLDNNDSNRTLANTVLMNGNGTLTGIGDFLFTGDFSETAGNRTLNINNVGTTTFGDSSADKLILAENNQARTLILNVSSTATAIINSTIQDGTGTGADILNKIGVGSLTINTAATYTGATQIDDGTLLIGVTDALPTGTAVRVGTGATAGVLDLNGFDQTIGSLSVTTNSLTAVNQIIIDSGKTLTINGAVTLGTNTNASTTLVDFLGGGDLVVNSGGGNLVVGNASGGTNDNAATADMSALANFTADLGAGVLRVGDTHTGTEIALATLKLAVNNTITASQIRVGDSVGGSTNAHTLTLGSGANILNADTINIGSAGAGIRSGGQIVFDVMDSTGNLTVRGSAGGVSRAILNMINTTGNTGGQMGATLDLTGHTSDLMISTLTMAARTTGAGAADATLTFDQGSLDATSIVMASRTGAGTGAATATLNLGDSIAMGTPTVTIGSIAMAENTSAGGTVSADINISGGTVAIGTGSGTAINMANAASGRTVTSTINIIGGSVTLSGDIVRTGGAGTENATIILNGATAVFDMGGFTIGSAMNAITLDGRQGTLRNLNNLNGGGIFTKTTAGTLTLDGSTSYSGGTALQQGMIIAAGGVNNRLGAAAALVFGDSATTGVLQLGDGAGASDQTVTSLSSSGVGTTNAIVGGNATFSTLTVDQSVVTTFNGDIGGVGTNNNNLNLVKTGSGELTLGGVSTYVGSTTVTGAGSKLTFAGAISGTTAITVGDGANLRLLNGVGDKLILSALTLGSMGGMLTELGFNVGDGAMEGDQVNTDTITLSTGGALTLFTGNQIRLNLTDIGLNAGQTYNLIYAEDGGLITGNLADTDWLLGATPGGFTSITLTKTDNLISITTGTLITGDWFWKGGAGTVWNDAANWADDKTGGTPRVSSPGQGSDVRFIADSLAGGAALTTTLEQNFKINSLTFEASTNPLDTPSSVTIDTGALTTSRLAIAPQFATDGLKITLGGPALVTINAQIRLGADQEWNVTSASTLVLTNSLIGPGALSINADSGSSGMMTGTIILRGADALATYSGATSLVAGRLILEGGADNRLPGLNDLTIGAGSSSAVLQIGDATNGASNTTTGNLSTSGTGTANAIVGGGATASTLTIVQGGNATFSGAIGGAGTNEDQLAITKQGTATLILDGALTYLGATTVNAGILQLGSTASLNQSSGLFVNASAGLMAVFDNNSRTTVFAGGITLGGADSSAAPVIANTGGGGSITLGGNIVFDATNDPMGGSIAAPLNFSATRTFTANDSATAAIDLTISGAVTGADTGLILDGTGSGLITGAVDLGTATTSDLTKNGTGEWTIQNVVTIGDNYTVNAGTLTISGNGSLTWNATSSADPDFVTDTGAPTINFNVVDSIVGNGGTNRILARDGTTINLNATNAIGASIESIFISGENSQGSSTLFLADGTTNTIAILDLGHDSGGTELGNVTGTGTIIVTTSLILDQGTASANLSGAASAIKNFNTTYTLSGINSLTGTTSNVEGTLALDFSINAGVDNKIGTGAFTVGSNTNNDNRSITSLIGNDMAASTQTVASLTVAGGPSEINLASFGGQNVTFAVTGDLTRTRGTVNLKLPDANTIFSYTGTTTNVNGIVGAWMTINDRDFATISEGQIVAATYTGQNNAGLWGYNENITNNAAFSGTVAECLTINSLRFDAAAASTITVADGERLTISSGGILLTSTVGSSASTITGGAVVSGTGEFIITQNNSGTFTIASRILGDAIITKNGTGTLVLSGTNNRTGAAIYIDEGILRLTGGSAVSDTTQINLRNVTGSALQLLANQTETIGSLAGDVGGSIVLNTNAILTVNQTSNQTVAAVFSGAGTLVKSGASTLTLTGTSTMTGTIQIDQGQITLSGNVSNIATATAIVLNGPTSALQNNQDQTAANNRILNTATILLNNTAGGTGFALSKSASTGNATEVVGALTLGAGHNVITATSAIAATVGQITFASLAAVNNHATLLVRGAALGNSATTQRGQIVFTAAPTGGVGTTAGGAVGTTKDLIILPYLVGDVSATGLGNTFVTNTGANGLRPLAAAEYEANAAAPTAGNNVRYTATTTITAATAVNSLVIDATTGRTITGPASDMEITSGAILSANASGTVTHTLAGFGGTNGITTGGGLDYTIYVTSATGTLLISSQLGSAVALVKSGAGTLSLTNAANAFTDVYLNQGTILVNDYDKLGSGTLNFAGGILKLNTGFADDLGGKTINLLTGGGTIDVGALNISATSLNISGSGALTKTGTGTLTIGDSATITNTGRTTVSQGTLLLNNTLGNSIGTGGVLISTSTVVSIVRLMAADQIANTASVELSATGGFNALFDLNGFSETIGNLTLTSATTGGATVKTGAAGVLTLTGDLVFNNNRVNDGSTTEFQMLVTGSGSLNTRTTDGFLDLGGASRTITVAATVAVPNRNDAVIETVIQNGGIIKEGARTLYLRAANTYTGETTINEGTLSLGNGGTTGSLSASSAINNDGILAFNRSNALIQGIDFASVIAGCGGIVQMGSGTTTLNGANTYSGVTTVNAGTLHFATQTSLYNNVSANWTDTNLVVNAGATAAFNVGGEGEFTSSDIAIIQALGSATGGFQSGSTIALDTSNAVAGSFTHSAVIADTNGGANSVSVTKLGVGTLVVDQANTYTGVTTVNAGTLQFATQTSLYNNVTANWTATNLVVNSSATAAFNVGGAGEFTSSDIATIQALGTANGGFRNGSTIGLDTSNAVAGSFTHSSVIGDTNGGANSVGVTKLGTGVLVLDQVNTYTGATLVEAGILQVGAAGTGQSGSGATTVASGATLAGSGAVVGSTIIGSGGVLQAGDVTMVGNAASTITSNGKLTFTAASTALTVQDGGQIRLGLTSTAQIDGSFDWTVNDALTYLDGNGGTSGAAYVSTWSQSGDYDSIKLTNGTFTLGSTAGGTIKLIDSGTTSYSLGQIFKLLDWSTVGSSNSLAGGGAFTLTDLDLSGVNLGGLAFDTSAFTTYGVVVIVPEPSRALLLLFGVFGLMMRRRRLKQW